MSVTTEKPAGATPVRPFRIEVPEEELAELRRRIAAKSTCGRRTRTRCR
jgi:hypothetical protein